MEPNPALMIVLLLCLLASLSAAAQGSGTRHVYVDIPGAQAGANELRDELIAQLRRTGAVALVEQRSAADVILAGNGEIWVKGYVSLNPRSGRSLSNARALYSGFLSVELKDAKGRILWSDLVNPHAPSETLAKDLSKQVARHVADALPKLDALEATVGSQSAVTLQGAGATFPQPIYSKWFANYATEVPGVSIAYDSVGSEEGVRRLLDGKVDFGASDSPEVIAAKDRDKYVLVPSVLGAVVPIVNVPGLAADISFTPEALAGIYLGKIKKWNDPILKQANPKVPLPDLDIIVVHRSDGSGTSYAWTKYLSAANPEWRAEVGAGLSPRWPAGRGAAGNDGVAKLVKEMGGAIGYVELIFALDNHVSFGKVKNRSGEFVTAGLASISAAARSKDAISDSIVDSPATGAYPITSFTWFLVPAHIADEGKRVAITAFLRWMLGPGQRQTAALGYAALPGAVVKTAEVSVAQIH